MKKIPQSIDDKLLDYLDGKLSQHELVILEEEIQRNEQIKARLESLRLTHQVLNQFKLEQPSKNFTQILMQKLDQAPARSTSFSIRNRIFLLVGVLAAVGIASLLVSAGVFDGPTAIDLNNINIPEKYIQQPLPTIPVSGKLIVNIIIILNLGLAWIILDRAILKPYFQRRVQTSH
jgi:hypothetical protein